MSVVQLSGVVKRYGRVLALDGLTLDVPRGAICALIGPNGSGKTTTFGLLAGLLRPDAGQIVLFGEG
ncbi:MAG: ATP-binding cassette domain-containing protein, partial [Polyangiaceae bacterium]